MQKYLKLAQHILDNGVYKEDRTGTGCTSVFGYQMRFDLSEGFPLVTTKKTHLKAIISELLWFIEGSTDERRLAEIHFGDKRENLIGKKTVWTANADKQGKDLGYINTDLIKELGPVYGHQWRSWQSNGKCIDQLAQVIEQIKTNPNSRRIILSAWNVGDLDYMALPPCHTFFQFYVNEYTNEDYHNMFIKLVIPKNSNIDPELRKEFMTIYDGISDRDLIDWKGFAQKFGFKTGKLSCQLYQRSADVFLGVPFNIASYALLTMMVAQVTDLEVGDFVHTIGDAHIYSNHVEQMTLQLTRKPYGKPTMKINPEVKDINDFKMEDFVLEDYQCHEPIKGKMAV